MRSKMAGRGYFSSGSFRGMFGVGPNRKMQLSDLVAQLDLLVLAKSIIVLGSAFVVSGMVFLLPNGTDRWSRERDLG
jgi:hypothetical protein